MSAHELTLEWVAKAEEDAAVAEREHRVRKTPSPGAVCYHAQQAIEKYLNDGAWGRGVCVALLAA